MAYSPHTETKIANIALSYIGAEEISDINTTTSEEARQVRTHFDLARDSLLRQHAWNFAVKRASLVQSSTTPVSGYAKAYLLPSDFLRPLAVNDTDAWEPSDRYSVENGLLLCEEGTAVLRYVARIDDASQWDALFTQAMTLELASRIATTLAQAPQMAAELANKARYAVGEAMKMDANENNKLDPTRASRSRVVRRRGRGFADRPDLSIKWY